MDNHSQHLINFNEYIIRQESKKTINGKDVPAYAHPIDQSLLNILSSARVKPLLNKAFDAYVSFGLGQELAEAVTIGQKSFPELFEIVSHCAQILSIPLPHTFASHRDGMLFNAYAAGTDNYAFIMIAATLCEVLPKEEACFIVGHECGHIAASHMIYHFLVRSLTQGSLNHLSPAGALMTAVNLAAGASLKAWSRRSEITADRAGLLCCGDIKIAERALMRLVMGLASLEKIDISHYLRDAEETAKRHDLNFLSELQATHPLIPKRIKALRLFANSELYYELTQKPRPAHQRLLTREELDHQVESIVKP